MSWFKAHAPPLGSSRGVILSVIGSKRPRRLIRLSIQSRETPTRISPPFRLVALLSVGGALACSGDAPAHREVTARSLGTLSLEEGEACGDGSRCIRFLVECPEVAEPVRGYMVIDDPDGPSRGTVATFSGGDGSWYLPKEGGPSGLMAYRAAWGELRDEGFRIVQVVWEGGWVDAAPASHEGLDKLSCRPATATAWIADNLTDAGTPLCAVGGSGGAAQVSYLLSHYGLEDRLALVLPFTGYWMGRIDLGCLDDDPLNSSLHYSDQARGFIDRTMGYPAGEGPCSRRDPSARQAFEAASIALGGNDYVHPNTLVYIVLAGSDDVGALAQGHTHYERLIREGSPEVKLDILPGAPHGLGEAGPPLIRDILARECRTRVSQLQGGEP